MKKEKEIKIVTIMIEKYCKGHHGTKKHELCEACSELLEYVKERRENAHTATTKHFALIAKYIVTNRRCERK